VTDKKQFTSIIWHLGIILEKAYSSGNHKAPCGLIFGKMECMSAIYQCIRCRVDLYKQMKKVIFKNQLGRFGPGLFHHRRPAFPAFL